MNDVKELSVVEKSLVELEIDDAELRDQKHKVSQEKQALQGTLAELNAKCAVRLPGNEFLRIQRHRGQLVRQLADKEGELGAINRQRSELQTVMQVRRRQAGEFLPKDVRLLVAIRDRWHGFSMDSKNHQKARETAWKFSQELRDFLKPHFQESQNP